MFIPEVRRVKKKVKIDTRSSRHGRYVWVYGIIADEICSFAK